MTANADLQTTRPQAHRRAWTTFSLVALVLVMTAFFFSGRIGADQAVAEVKARARNSAALKVAILLSELEKQRSLPFVLAQDREVQLAMLEGGADRLQAINAKLLALKRDTGASVIYVVDAAGVSVVASNAQEPVSFVGTDYAFRAYFRDAITNGSAEYFALGTVSHRAGLYLARRIDHGGKALGVVVVKVEFDKVEENWRRFPDPTFVTDEQGIVLLSAVPEWKFKTLAPLSEASAAALQRSQQFGDKPLEVLPWTPDPAGYAAGAMLARLPGTEWDESFVHEVMLVPSTSWTFHFLGATGDAVARASTVSRVIGVLLTLLVLFGIGVLLHRRFRAADEVAVQHAVRSELERRVLARTAQLREANQQLLSEMEDRRRAEASLNQLQDELVQANKLAFLGQITAGVAHEINQPVAAIRSYADNAAVYLARGSDASVHRNLGLIADLTQRIGAITAELRTFSRKASGDLVPTPVTAAVEGALLLLGNHLQRQGVALRLDDQAPGVRVLAERVRLEQVLVNLLQNALDALVGRGDGMVELGIRAEHERVLVTVRDNGPGIAADVMAAMFTPFLTTKPQGLGLGLVISRDILTEFGGELLVDSTPGEGTSFTLVLRKANHD